MPADRHLGLPPPDAPSLPDAAPVLAPVVGAAPGGVATADSRPLQDLPPDQQRAVAQEMARAEPELTGKILAARFGRRERWGREQLAAARNNGTGTRRATRPPARHNGTRPATNGRDSGTPTTPRHNIPTGTPHDDRPASARTTGAGTRHAAAPPARHNSMPAANVDGTESGTPGEPHGGPAHAGTGPTAGRATALPEMTGRDHQAPAAPRSLIVLTVVAVAIVAVVTMVTSYTHTHDLAVMAGWGWLAAILPAAVDGLVVAGSTSLMVDRHLRGRTYPGHPLAWAAVAIGLASSMAANIVAVDPTLVDMRVVRWVMAGYAPVALAISGHLLLRMLGER